MITNLTAGTALLLLVACGGGGPALVTDEEAGAFVKRAQAEGHNFADADLRNLDKQICDGFAKGLTYGRVSKVVAAYIRAEPSDAAVDQLIKAAQETSCPTK